MAIETAIVTGIEYFPNPTIGRPVFNGSVYVGIIDLDPKIEANRITVTVIEEDGTRVSILPSAQPLLTGQGGVIIYNGKPVSVVTDKNYSIRVDDSLGVQVYYVPFVQNIGTVLGLVSNNYTSVALAKSDLSISEGDRIETSSYRDGWAAFFEGKPKGGGNYNIITLADFQLITGLSVPDEYGDHTLDNGLIMMVDSSEGVFVSRYGTYANGITPDTLQCRAAWAAADRLGIGLSVPSQGSRPVMMFHSGHYYIDDYIVVDNDSQVAYHDIRGENAVIEMAPGVTAFGGVSFVVKFSGLQFRGGATGISIKNNNTNSTTLFIDKCEFSNQSVACVRSSVTASSNLIRISESKFNNNNIGDGYIFDFQRGDQITIEHNWITCHSAVAMRIDISSFTMDDNLLVPGGDMNIAGTGRWIDNYGAPSILRLTRNRFGGEGGGATLIRNYADMDIVGDISPTTILVEDNGIFASNRNVIEFYKLPNKFTFSHNGGLSGVPQGLYFDSTLTVTDFKNFALYGNVTMKENYPNNMEGMSNNYTQNQFIGEQLFLAKRKNNQSVRLNTQGKVKIEHFLGSSNVQVGWSQSGSASTIGGILDEYGVDSYEVQATADDQNKNYTRNTYLIPTVLTPFKMYTMVFTVEGKILSKTIEIIFEIGAMRVYLPVFNDVKTTYSVPFVYLNDTGIADPSLDRVNIAMFVMKSGDQIRLNKLMLLEGMYEYGNDTLVASGSGVPGVYTAGTDFDQGFVVGDVSYRQTPAAGLLADACTVTGNPGTWVQV